MRFRWDAVRHTRYHCTSCGSVWIQRGMAHTSVEVLARMVPRSPSSPIVLLVDDDCATLGVFSLFVEEGGYTPLTAEGSDEALRIVGSQHVDVAVVDIVMPGHDGSWLIHELARQYPHVPVVIATGLSELDARLTLGPTVAAYLVKPFTAETLMAVLDVVTGRASAAAVETID